MKSGDIRYSYKYTKHLESIWKTWLNVVCPVNKDVIRANKMRVSSSWTNTEREKSNLTFPLNSVKCSDKLNIKILN